MNKNVKSSRVLRAISCVLILVPFIFITFFFDEAAEFFGLRSTFAWCAFFSMVVGFMLGRLSRRKLKDDTTKSVRQVKHLLFPPAVKWVGFGIAAAGTVLLIVLHYPWLWSVMIAGLWIAMWSRDNLEDEMLREVRLSAAWFALSFVALYAVITSASPEGTTSLGIGQMVFIVMLYYHVVLCIFKRKIRNDEKHD